MSIPDDASQANANSIAAKTALQTEADNEFISQAAEAIANAEAMGIYFVVLTTFKNCNILSLQNYFIGLGYQVSYPYNLVLTTPLNSYQDLGGSVIQTPLRNPVRMRLRWNLP